ncbi:MAG TPA: decarboxylating 6-phosphogluconate dehydrogenase [Patescibacteria group bacterium]|nr:decarboxylating 6-phosphogluconate dehydrogenase [Patescibacteria group bacterium]
MKVGIVGLGKMGSRIAQKLIKDSHDVIVWNRTREDVENLKKEIPNLKSAETIKELVESLETPRIIWIMVPSIAIDEVISEVQKYLQKGDIVIDGGNSDYKETEKRFQNFKNKGIRFLGIGVSGGILAFKNGYPLMAGGDKSAYDLIKPILDSLAKPNGGYEYFGEGGAGHFVKMVHNGIEYGMMQGLGEGFGVLEKAPYKFDLLKVAKIWQKGTVISGFLMDRTKEVFESDIKNVVGIIDATGEAEWTVEAAKEEGVPIEVIEKSLEFRKRSKIDSKIQNSFAAKVIAGLRHSFGGHSVVRKE